MNAARRFDFDTVFSPEGEVLRQGESHKRIFTIEELEAAKAEAFAQGQHSETVRAEKAALEAARALAAEAKRLAQGLEGECKALRQEAAALALAAGRALAGAALDAYGEERASRVVEAALEHLRSQPRILVKVAASAAPRLEPRLTALAEEQGLAGALLVRADPAAQPGDVALEWAGGKLGVSIAEIQSRLEALAAGLIHDIESAA